MDPSLYGRSAEWGLDGTRRRWSTGYGRDAGFDGCRLARGLGQTVDDVDQRGDLLGLGLVFQTLCSSSWGTLALDFGPAEVVADNTGPSKAEKLTIASL
jgi:hypothetical protein